MYETTTETYLRQSGHFIRELCNPDNLKGVKKDDRIEVDRKIKKLDTKLVELYAFFRENGFRTQVRETELNFFICLTKEVLNDFSEMNCLMSRQPPHVEGKFQKSLLLFNDFVCSLLRMAIMSKPSINEVQQSESFLSKTLKFLRGE